MDYSKNVSKKTDIYSGEDHSGLYNIFFRVGFCKKYLDVDYALQYGALRKLKKEDLGEFIKILEVIITDAKEELER